MKKHGFPRFPKGSCEIWVSIQTTPPSCVQAELRVQLPHELRVAAVAGALRELHVARQRVEEARVDVPVRNLRVVRALRLERMPHCYA